MGSPWRANKGTMRPQKRLGFCIISLYYTGCLIMIQGSKPEVNVSAPPSSSFQSDSNSTDFFSTPLFPLPCSYLQLPPDVGQIYVPPYTKARCLCITVLPQPSSHLYRFVAVQISDLLAHSSRCPTIVFPTNNNNDATKYE